MECGRGDFVSFGVCACVFVYKRGLFPALLLGFLLSTHWVFWVSGWVAGLLILENKERRKRKKKYSQPASQQASKQAKPSKP